MSALKFLFRPSLGSRENPIEGSSARPLLPPPASSPGRLVRVELGRLRRWSPASRLTLGSSLAGLPPPGPLLGPSPPPVHLRSPQIGPLTTLAFLMQRWSLDRLVDLAPDTAGKRWNVNSDPGLSDSKAHVPSQCIAWFPGARFPPAMGSSEQRGKLSVCGPRTSLCWLPAQTPDIRLLGRPMDLAFMSFHHGPS